MRLSYSSINTYETCPAKYRFQYEDRLPSAPSPALSFGDSLHQALYRFHSRPVPVAPPLPELLEMLDGVWVADGYANVSEEQAYLEHGRQVLERYHRDNAGRYAIPAAMEFRFRIEIEGVQVSGVIDRMDRIPGGGYEIVDYKTNRRLPPQRRVDEDLQLSVYYLAAQQIWGIEPEQLTLYYLLPGQRIPPSARPRTPTRCVTGSPRSPSASRRASSSRVRTRCATGATTRPGARCSGTRTRSRTAIRPHG
jgi:RecB family exonuclease